MPLTVNAAATAGHVPTIAVPPLKAATPAKSSVATVAAQPPAASAAGSSAQQRAGLNRMLVTYARYQSHGTDVGTLSALGKQIMAAAKAIGQHVTLPHAPASAGVAVATPAAPEKGRVSVTA